MQGRSTKALPILLIGLALLAGGCVLLSEDSFQTLILYFELTEDVPEGEAFLAHTAVYPHPVKLRKQFVRISGRIDPSPAEQADGSDDSEPVMATNILVEAIGEQLETQSRDHKFRNKIKIADDGSFEAVKKFRKNIGADVMQTITVEGLNGVLPSGTKVALCIDIAARKKDFSEENSCATPLAPTDGEAHTVQVLDNSFEPQRLTIEPGDTVRWELTGVDPSHTVTAMDGAFDSGFVFTEQGAIFERTFPASEDGETFEYFCETHQACCQMQGSILVGPNAEPPSDGY